MKYFYIGTAILLLLLLSALLLGQCVAQQAELTVRLLLRSSEALERGDFPGAVQAGEQAAAQWNAQAALLSVLLGHDVLDEISEGFCRLHAYGALEDAAEYRSECDVLHFRLEHIAERDFSFWYNFLAFTLDPPPSYAV